MSQKQEKIVKNQAMNQSTRAEIPIFLSARVPRSPTSKPMLARVAESMYWMSRYMERAEHVARITQVNFNMLMDLGEIAHSMQEKQWQAVLHILRLDQSPEAQALFASPDRNLGQHLTEFKTLNLLNKNSLLNCLTKARENARSIRESISAEMWETLNTLYWSLLSDDAKQRLEESPQQIFQSVIMGSMLFQGVSDQTLPHGQGWQFIQLAKYLERVDMTCRVIDTLFDVLRSNEATMEGPLKNIQWMAVLRCCSSIEAFRRRHVGDLDPQRLAAFLILDKESPRSIRYCIRAAQKAVAGIATAVHPQEIDPAERILGRLNSQLEYAETREFTGVGLKYVLKQILDNTAESASAIQRSYFLH
ncbi:MAG: alpha-E domain-containing protein [Candidatus Obscuribacterales bacterium]|nr:alpha-E domain-containing protein [Candidatus Obscuribacterales bacterium]